MRVNGNYVRRFSDYLIGLEDIDGYKEKNKAQKTTYDKIIPKLT